ncbi:MAG: hypothetical protein AABZ45_06550 [Pseudomonadota bacterium]
MMAKPSKLTGPVTKIGRALGGALAGKVGGGKAGKAARTQADDPIIGAVVGATTLFVATKLLPRRVVAIGAAVAAGYVTRKLAQRAERVNAREADPAITAEPVAPVTAPPAP